MSFYMHGWIEVKGITGWHAIIKIDPHVFPLLNKGKFMHRFYETAERGCPADPSEEVRRRWSRSYESPASILWSKAEQVDTQNMQDHEDDWWWKLKAMVEILKGYYVPDDIRLVFWMM